MKNKKVLIIIISIIIFIIPIITFASIKIRDKDSEGRTIVYSADDINDLEPGTKISLAIPTNTANDSEILDKEIKAEKERIMNEAERNNSLQRYSFSEEKRSELNDELSQFENKELENKEEEFKEIFCKYYGDEYSKELFAKINEEFYEISGEYTVPESSKSMLKKAIELLENNDVTESEKETIRYILNAIDTSFIEDDETLNALKNAEIELD